MAGLSSRFPFQVIKLTPDVRHNTLIFCDDLNHVQQMMDTFRQYGIDARSVTSKCRRFTPMNILTLATNRHSLMQQFRNREFPVLVNFGILIEGIDMPNIDCVLLARSTASFNRLVQILDRRTRLAPGKQDCHVINLVGSLQRFKFKLDFDDIIDVHIWRFTSKFAWVSFGDYKHVLYARGHGVVRVCKHSDGIHPCLLF